MQIKENKKWKGLAYRLLYVVCSTFLPLNLLAIMVCGMIIAQSSAQIQDSYQRELDSYMDRLVSELSKVEESVSEFIMDYLTELNLRDGSDNMISYEMVSSLHETFSDTGREGLVYLFDKGSGRLFLRYTRGSYHILQAEAMKNALLEDGLPEGTGTGWQLFTLKGKSFWIKYYEYTNYRLGFLVDVEKYMSEMSVYELWENNRVYVTDGAVILSWQDGILKPEEGKSWEEILRESFLARNVQWHSEELGLMIGIHMVGENYREKIPAGYWVLLAAAVASLFLVFVMWKLLQNRVIGPLHTLQEAMQELEKDHLEYRIESWDRDETDDFIYIYETFNRMAREIGLSREKDIKMYQAQLDNLRLQVNPHMLLNSFNMIYSLAQSRNYECIQEYSLLLVEYFRYALKETDHFVLLYKEMKFVESYTGIQKIRFPGTFTSVYNIQEGCEEALVPPLLIQNFVENSMKYAFIPGKVIEVLINIRRQEERLLISVCDTGRGIKPEVLKCLLKDEMYEDQMGQKHIGIWNCRRRMEVFYGEQASMNIVSTPGAGTQVWLDLPFMTVPKKEG